jgi:hypothetical protein
VSSTKSVGLGETLLWAYDVSVSLLLAELIGVVEERLPDERPAWWPGIEHDVRVHAIVSDFHLDLSLGLEVEQREELASLLEEATSRIRQRGQFTAEEAGRWRLLDDSTVLFRGTDPIDTAMVAELGAAVVALLRGQLPQAPTGTRWLFGSSGGRRTITTTTQ